MALTATTPPTSMTSLFTASLSSFEIADRPPVALLLARPPVGMDLDALCRPAVTLKERWVLLQALALVKANRAAGRYRPCSPSRACPATINWQEDSRCWKGLSVTDGERSLAIFIDF